MWYVYCKYIKSGKEGCVNRTFDTPEEAIKHIALCYATDKDLHQLGEYYYFMKKALRRNRSRNLKRRI